MPLSALKCPSVTFFSCNSLHSCIILLSHFYLFPFLSPSSFYLLFLLGCSSSRIYSSDLCFWNIVCSYSFTHHTHANQNAKRYKLIYTQLGGSNLLVEVSVEGSHTNQSVITFCNRVVYMEATGNTPPSLLPSVEHHPCTTCHRPLFLSCLPLLISSLSWHPTVLLSSPVYLGCILPCVPTTVCYHPAKLQFSFQLQVYSTYVSIKSQFGYSQSSFVHCLLNSTTSNWVINKGSRILGAWSHSTPPS